MFRIKVDGIMVDTEVFSNLAAGASVSVQTSSPWQAVAGTKTLAVLADDPNQVAESNESNNSRSLSFTVAEPPPPPEPDLIVKSVALVGSNLVDGDNVYVSAVVQNVGDAATPSNQSVTVSVKVNGSMVDTEAFANLAAGASVSIQTSTPWQATAGTKTLSVQADDPNQVQESDEGNNSKSMSFTVAEAPTPGDPDLVIDSVQQSPTNPAEGDAVHFTATVRNAGTVATPTGQAVSVSFSVNGTVFTSVSTTPLGARSSATVSTNGGSGWVATAGDKILTATADPSGNIAEGLESNNTRSKSFTVAEPPLPPASQKSRARRQEAGFRPNGNPSDGPQTVSRYGPGDSSSQTRQRDKSSTTRNAVPPRRPLRCGASRSTRH